MHERTARLRNLKQQHNLTGKRISEILGRNHNTAMIWLMAETTRVIPEHCLRVLELEFGSSDGQQTDRAAD